MHVVFVNLTFKKTDFGQDRSIYKQPRKRMRAQTSFTFRVKGNLS